MPNDAAETWQLPTRHLGRRVDVFEQLDSTNTHALSLGHDPTQHGLVLLARQQSAGRGQHGRTWQAPANSSVLLSVLLFAPQELRRPALLTAWAAVSVCETIAHLAGRQATIKWPNDVLLDGKKVCGILSEQRTSGQSDFPLATVVGMGLNVTQSEELFQQAGLPAAGSLHSLTGHTFDTADVARQLITQLDDEYDRLTRGDWAPLETRWRQRLGLLGQHVAVEGIAHDVRGRLLDVTLTGLELDVGAGEVVRIAPEAVRHVTALGGD